MLCWDQSQLFVALSQVSILFCRDLWRLFGCIGTSLTILCRWLLSLDHLLLLHILSAFWSDYPAGFREKQDSCQPRGFWTRKLSSKSLTPRVSLSVFAKIRESSLLPLCNLTHSFSRLLSVCREILRRLCIHSIVSQRRAIDLLPVASHPQHQLRNLWVASSVALQTCCQVSQCR